MKKILTLSSLFILFSFSGYSQLRVDANGNPIVRYGTFSASYDGILYLGDYNHYIKSKFGYGVSIGTAGSTEAIRIPQYQGRIGIFREPSYCLDVNGAIRSTQALIVSDERFKTNIVELNSRSSMIYQLNPVSYYYKPNSFNNSAEFNSKSHFGFLAQELNKVFPELVYTDSAGYMSVDYIGMIPLLVSELQAQNEKIAELENKLSQFSQNGNLENPQVLTKGFMEQNSPNPFSVETRIKYFVPLTAGKSFISIYDLGGVELKKIELTDKGASAIAISAGDFKAGTYVYTLNVDGVIVDTKMMIITQ